MGFGSMLKEYLYYYKISQTDFAQRLGISTKHMNEILNENTSVSIDMLFSIGLLTKIDVNLMFYVEQKKLMEDYLTKHFKNAKEVNAFLEKYYVSKLDEANWITFKDRTSSIQTAIDLLSFLGVKSFDLVPDYIKNKLVYENTEDLIKTYLWTKRCENKILNEKIATYDKNKFNLLLEQLKDISKKKFNEQELINLLKDFGIYLVIENTLPDTKAKSSMTVRNLNPAIYISGAIKDKATFFFTLYKELCLIKTNYNMAKNKIIIQMDDMAEKKGEEFALNQMVDDSIWNNIINNYDLKDLIARKNKIQFSFMYFRLVREKKLKINNSDYLKNRESIFNNIIE